MFQGRKSGLIGLPKNQILTIGCKLKPDLVHGGPLCFTMALLQYGSALCAIQARPDLCTWCSEQIWFLNQQFSPLFYPETNRTDLWKIKLWNGREFAISKRPLPTMLLKVAYFWKSFYFWPQKISSSNSAQELTFHWNSHFGAIFVM